MTTATQSATELAARHRAVLPAWVTPSYREPIALASGSGRHVTDTDGRRYLDFFAGVLTNLVGYAIPEIVSALEARLRTGIIHSSTAYLIEPQIELAERIAALSGIPDAKVYFTNSGSESVDAALLLATEYRRAGQILALRNSYHGRTFAAVSVTGNQAWRPTDRAPMTVTFLPGYVRTATDRLLSDDEFTARSLREAQLVLDSTGTSRIAAVIAEPIQGVGGFSVPTPGWFTGLARLLAPTECVVIADETQTGWGRTGDTFWGFQFEGLQPDLVTFAKGLGNGLAIGGVVGRADVVDCLSSGSTSTFGGNHLATTGALAVLDYIAAHGLQANAATLGRNMIRALCDGTADLPAVVDVRGRGLMIGLELADPETGDPAPDLAAAVHEACRERGLLIGRGGLYANALRIGPPLSLTTEEADTGTALLLDALHAVTPR
jgi:4-aminobutyrate aminotransferase